MNKEKNKPILRLKITPTGDTFLTYEKFDYLLNGELIDINVNNILYLKNSVQALYDLVNNLPDLSGVYTKDEINTLLTNYYTKTETDTLLLTKANTSDITQLNGEISDLSARLDTSATDISNNTTTITQNTTDITNLTTRVGTNETNISTNTTDIANIKTEQTTQNTNISANTTAINTLEVIVEENFSTFGEYHSTSGTLPQNNEYRPVLEVDKGFDEKYVVVDIDPEQNLFTHKTDGRIVFSAIIDNVSNLSGVEVPFSLNIYYNAELSDTQTKNIPIDFNGSGVFTGAFDVEKDSQVYFTFKCLNGDITTINTPRYFIQFSSNSLSSITSSVIVNDKATLPNSGINSDLNTISTNTIAITNNTNQINNIINTIIPTLYLPIGTIIISDTQPTYGTWELVGTLAEGQSLIGGSSSAGKVAKHLHTIATQTYNSKMSHDDLQQIAGFDGFTANGQAQKFGRGSGDSFIDGTYGAWYTNFYPEDSGTDYNNYAYGLGIGTSKNVYRRTA